VTRNRIRVITHHPINPNPNRPKSQQAHANHLRLHCDSVSQNRDVRELTSCSGPWLGQSIQDGLRITENITLSFHGESFLGNGSDKDGLFNLSGEHDPSDNGVMMTRVYTYCNIAPEQAGYPFIYVGRWDGHQIHGRWMMSTHPAYGGTFEMWPEDEEERQERMINLEQEPAGIANFSFT
jgi:hypothetical protein